MLERMIDERNAGNALAISQETEDYNAVMKSWGNVSGDKSAAAALRVERILINYARCVRSPVDDEVRPNLESFRIAIGRLDESVRWTECNYTCETNSQLDVNNLHFQVKRSCDAGCIMLQTDTQMLCFQ